MTKVSKFKEVGHIGDIDNRRIFAYRDGTYHIEGMSDSSLMPVFYDSLTRMLYDLRKLEGRRMDVKKRTNTQYHL